MKKTVTLCIFALLFSVASHSQARSTSLKDFDLKGQVKSVNEVTYLGVLKFGDITKGRKLSESEDKFNKNGFATDRDYIYYDEDGKKENGFMQSFSYDKNNFLIAAKEQEDEESVEYKLTNDANGKVQVLDAYTKKGKLLLRQKTKYNKDGKEIEIAEYNGDGALAQKITITYGSYGERKEERITDESGKLTEVNLTFYDAEGNVFEENMIKYKATGKEEYLRKYKYNAANKKIEARNSISGLDKKEVFIYDDKGNLVKNVDEHGTTEVITYTYDNQGNWIKKISEKKDVFLGDKVEITERVIRYY